MGEQLPPANVATLQVLVSLQGVHGCLLRSSVSMAVSLREKKAHGYILAGEL